MTTLTRDEARAILARTRSDPAWYCHNVLGCEPYDKQIEIIESVRDNEQTSVNGANGVGKDWMIGRIVPWWLNAYAPHAVAIVTGPTFRQIQEIVWRETRGAVHAARYDLGGRMLPSEAKWDFGGTDLYALGFSTDHPANITGFHSANLLAVVSEAHNFSDAAMVNIKRLQPNRLLLSANPFAQSGEFFDSQHSKRHLYNAITITAYDSPNVKAGDSHIPGLVTARDIERMAEDWGADSPFFRATVLAEFVETEDGLLPLAWLLAAHDRPSTPVAAAALHAGLDVAGPGEDETSLWIREGSNIIHHWSSRMPEPRGEVVAQLEPYRSRLAILNVDSAGIGYYMAQHLRDQGFNVREVNVGEKANDSEKFANLKAELYWGLRMRFQSGDVNGLDDDLAISQLAGIRYGHNSRGQVQIESKDDARKRGVKSPDRGEGIMLCFAYGDNLGSTAELIKAFAGPTERPMLDVAERDAREDDRDSRDNIARKQF